MKVRVLRPALPYDPSKSSNYGESLALRALRIPTLGGAEKDRRKVYASILWEILVLKRRARDGNFDSCVQLLALLRTLQEYEERVNFPIDKVKVL